MSVLTSYKDLSALPERIDSIVKIVQEVFELVNWLEVTEVLYSAEG